jgi:hypothetical protein
MSDLPAEYHFHELKKLFGDYKPTGTMPCFRCNEPESHDICFAFAKFGAAAHDRLPRGTMPKLDALFAPEPKPEPEPTSEPEPGPRLLSDDNLFMLRDYVLSGETLMAAAIKAAGGLRALSRKLGIRLEVIEQWKRIPAGILPVVAKVTGLPQHVLRPDLFDVSAPQFYWTEEEADEIWKWSHAWQLWLPLPYPPGFLPTHCCARRPRLALVVNKD